MDDDKEKAKKDAEDPLKTTFEKKLKLNDGAFISDFHPLPGFLPTFPWDHVPKWPLTRAERIAELEKISPHYEQTLQKKNIRAARAWHAKFPPDQTIPDEFVYFQNGEKMEMSEINLENGAAWEEGPPPDDFMNL